MKKKELIKALLKGEEITKESYIFSVEYHKMSEKIGFMKFEVLDAKSEKLMFNFKYQMDPSSPENVKNFASLEDG